MNKYKLHYLPRSFQEGILFIFSKDGKVIDMVPRPKSSGLPPSFVKVQELKLTEKR